MPVYKAIEVKKPVPYSLAMDAEHFYNTFFSLLENNPPAEVDAEFLSKFRFMDDLKGLSFSKLNAEEKKLLTEGLIAKQKKFSDIFYAGNEQTSAWDFKIEEMGTWNTNYARRAYYAVWGIGANIPQDAVYGVSQFCLLYTSPSPRDS